MVETRDSKKNFLDTYATEVARGNLLYWQSLQASLAHPATVSGLGAAPAGGRIVEPPHFDAPGPAPSSAGTPANMPGTPAANAWSDLQSYGPVLGIGALIIFVMAKSK